MWVIWQRVRCDPSVWPCQGRASGHSGSWQQESRPRHAGPKSASGTWVARSPAPRPVGQDSTHRPIPSVGPREDQLHHGLSDQIHTAHVGVSTPYRSQDPESCITQNAQAFASFRAQAKSEASTKYCYYQLCVQRSLRLSQRDRQVV